MDDMYKKSSDVRLMSKRVAELEMCHSVYFIYIYIHTHTHILVCVCVRACVMISKTGFNLQKAIITELFKPFPNFDDRYSSLPSVQDHKTEP